MSLSLDYMASNVRRLRAAKKFSQEKLAEVAQLNINTITRIERKLGSPSWETVHRIAEALGVDPFELTSKTVESSSKD